MTRKKFKTVEEYFSSLPEDKVELLKEVRKTIKNAAPGAKELISYNMPAFKQNGMLVWYAAFKNHIGFYPFPTAIKAFKKELSEYEGAKGSVKFPLDKPMPLGLISKIVKFRVREDKRKSC